MGYWYRENEPYKSLLELCDELGFKYETHDSHGFFIDVLAPKPFWIDPTPDSIWADGKLLVSYPEGTCFIRDSTHHYKDPTYLAQFDMNKPGFIEEMRQFLKTGFNTATPVRVLENV